MTDVVGSSSAAPDMTRSSFTTREGEAPAEPKACAGATQRELSPPIDGIETASIEGRSLRIPSGSLLRVFLREGVWITCLWFVVYGGANWITGLHAYRVRLWTGLEMQIPYVPAAAAVYLSIFPMFWIAPFVLHTREQLQSVAKALAWLIVVAGIGFLLLPGEHAYPAHAPTGFAGTFMKFADRLNMTYNYLPSLHVGMSVVCAYTYSQTVSRSLAAIFWIWAAAIAISTLLTQQHFLADIFTGGALGYLMAVKYSSCAAPID